VRCIVLRKLAPALRHMMMGELQTIEFTAALCAATLRKSQDSSALESQLGKLTEQARAAAARCRMVTDLLRPAEASVMPFGDAVREAMKLAGADWSIRGVNATFRCSEATEAAMVRTMIAREVVVTALLTLVDLYASALDIALVGHLRDRGVALHIEIPTPPRGGSVLLAAPRDTLGWDDVLAIAAEHAVPCACNHGTRSIDLRLPLVLESSGSPS
jgi:hypothetical protein